MGRVRTFVSDEAALAWSGRAKLVRAKGLEPPHSLEYQDLNLARLPVPPRPPGRRSGLPLKAGRANRKARIADPRQLFSARIRGASTDRILVIAYICNHLHRASMTLTAA